MGRTMFAIIMNKESWSALPKDVQQVMDNLSGQMVQKGAEIMHAETDSGTKQYLEAGGKIIEPTPEQEKAWQDARDPLENFWLESLSEKGKGDVAKKMLKRFKEIAAEKTKNL
jgi:TRAP-type C4-dicarboxylate transport system substrate-binding protein